MFENERGLRRRRTAEATRKIKCGARGGSNHKCRTNRLGRLSGGFRGRFLRMRCNKGSFLIVLLLGGLARSFLHPEVKSSRREQGTRSSSLVQKAKTIPSDLSQHSTAVPVQSLSLLVCTSSRARVAAEIVWLCQQRSLDAERRFLFFRPVALESFPINTAFSISIHSIHLIWFQVYLREREFRRKWTSGSMRSSGLTCEKSKFAHSTTPGNRPPRCWAKEMIERAFQNPQC